MLVKVAIAILIARVIDLFWLVAPEFHTEGIAVSWLDVLLPLSLLAIWLGGEIPAAPFWKGGAAYSEILGQTPRILAASFVAYLAGEFANSFVLAKMKILTQGRWLWTRTIGSTVVGQALDSAVFVALAFAPSVPTGVLIGIMIGQWIVKVLYEAAATPLTYAAVAWLKARERTDAYDYDTDFNPIRL